MFQNGDNPMRLLKFFDKYVQLGLQPIAIYKNSKQPCGMHWNKNWSVEKWRPYFLQNNYNMGILLGDVVDVEGDSEEANDLLERMIDGVRRPRYRSSRSIHNLFLSPDQNLTRLVANGIEFRGYSHQSVVPPSCHEDGSNYFWLAGSEFPIPPMPQELLDFYNRNKSHQGSKKPAYNKQNKNKKHFIKTVCKSCNESFFIHKVRLQLEVKAFMSHDSIWLCRNCRKYDVKKDCRAIKKSMTVNDYAQLWTS